MRSPYAGREHGYDAEYTRSQYASPCSINFVVEILYSVTKQNMSELCEKSGIMRIFKQPCYREPLGNVVPFRLGERFLVGPKGVRTNPGQAIPASGRYVLLVPSSDGQVET